jgi:hypothetical protein
MVTEAEERVIELEKKLADMQGSRLTATDMYKILEREIKSKSITIYALIVCWFLSIAFTVGGFIWYLTLPVEESVYVDQETNDNSNASYIGGDYIGTSKDN